MSQATKRKHVVKEVLGEHMVPSDQQQIVRVLRTPGNNLHEVETAQGQRFLVSMPSKYRKNIWIKRGDFLIVDPIEEGEKVKAEISFVLCKDHVRSLQKEGLWPEAFSEVAEKHNNRNRLSQNSQLSHSHQKNPALKMILTSSLIPTADSIMRVRRRAKRRRHPETPGSTSLRDLSLAPLRLDVPRVLCRSSPPDGDKAGPLSELTF
ncbi:probable RNA-binding protein EIF1AD isoform X1 [Pteropus alecto]|uniref:Probable RNA-binding protein EIF1AD n=1 Tax=Pteropus vampyrus TaxID=132908 RepID=A0A6P3QQH4_PTEVA|nr:probable RNA-binding protein EIF1AD isoform X1 [Pteropus vampyrus]XP_011367184.1 probable RNA-binding protein EIF1AD isoform X1 [Pteropus vampyrus]XP_011367186.1 probable RNA-binding protein EIF1AD isoform X1 [Pteropus vampyrus]XP_015444283.1 probable RNA-binding protein EIF1AD isoform X1 [Pteropus alecto]XP_015444284.1 probable RNA-binding protein EIF1AD isoform X1 [Pteropus alecto]XP_015444287.1 probable RNA-binding protein EIF1AD isoform X1 [Pteropus alecto]XP_039696778.1 probable RNA-b